MEIINLSRDHAFAEDNDAIATSFAIKLEQLGDIWLFNCTEGCQHIFIKKQIKISQISKVIVTELDIQNIAGLPGLLSSLSLSSRLKALHIYGPPGIEKYLEFGRKYSQTNYCYILHIHKLTTGLMINHGMYQLYSFQNALIVFQFEFLIIRKEKQGKFNLDKATFFNIVAGPLYGKLKTGADFLLPDGSMVSGQNFTGPYYSGTKISFVLQSYNTRKISEIGWNSKTLIYRTYGRRDCSKFIV